MKRKNILFFILFSVAVCTVVILYFFAPVIKIFAEELIIKVKYSSEENFESAFEAMRANLRLIRVNPQNDSAYYSMGQGFYALKGYGDAIEAFKHAVEINPGDDAYWFFLGKVYQLEKEYEEARDAFIASVELGMPRVNEYQSLAWLYYFRLDSEKNKAYDVLKAGLEKFPADKDILFDLTRYYVYDENREEFLKYAPRYLELDPDNELIKPYYDKWR